MPKPKNQLLLALAFVASPICSLAQEPPFKVEESYRATVGTTNPLLAGTVLKFSSPELKPNEVFVLQRCGEPCNTSKMIRTWKKSDFERPSPRLAVLTEDGTYYFWILRTLANGEVGPVLAEGSTFEGMKGTIRFASGTSVSVEVELPKAEK